ncbi:MAG: alpha-1,2-fucosyltransferase [Methanoregula sp.]|nr:alpha-1,2-fucosyltransferase [Methanoregula sp.]
MTIIKIKGGLGNQMFQYAYGRKLELGGKKIIFDISFFHGARAATDTGRNFLLPFFKLKTEAEFSPRARRLRDLMAKFVRKIGAGIEEYFQGEKYFKDISGELKKEFILKNDLSPNGQNILKQIIASNSVSVHLRRGDYVSDQKTKAYHGVCEPEYYNKAVQIIKEKVVNPTFFVFSDDIGWAKSNLNIEDSIFVSNPEIKDCEEMILMSNCKHNIVANSSFSWWGAWLNNNPEKIVIAPKRWFLDKKVDKNDIVPNGWIKI